MGWGIDPSTLEAELVQAHRPHPLMSPWAEVDRLKATVLSQQTTIDGLTGENDRLCVVVDQYKDAYNREVRARHKTFEQLNIKTEYIATLLDEIAELRDVLSTYSEQWVEDPDHDYVHESAQERYDNEQRDGREV